MDSINEIDFRMCFSAAHSSVKRVFFVLVELQMDDVMCWFHSLRSHCYVSSRRVYVFVSRICKLFSMIQTQITQKSENVVTWPLFLTFFHRFWAITLKPLKISSDNQKRNCSLQQHFMSEIHLNFPFFHFRPLKIFSHFLIFKRQTAGNSNYNQLKNYC